MAQPTTDRLDNAESSNLLPVNLPATTTEFVANGHTYFVQHNLELSVARDRWLERYSLYASLGRDASSLLAEVRRIYDFLNESKIADAVVTADNLMRGAADLLSRESPILYICTLFINRENEDLKGYDPELAKQKIADWNTAGITKRFFLSWGLSFLRITDENLSVLTRISLSASLPVLDVLGQKPPEPSPLDSN